MTLLNRVKQALDDRSVSLNVIHGWLCGTIALRGNRGLHTLGKRGTRARRVPGASRGLDPAGENPKWSV